MKVLVIEREFHSEAYRELVPRLTSVAGPGYTMFLDIRCTCGRRFSGSLYTAVEQIFSNHTISFAGQQHFLVRDDDAPSVGTDPYAL